MSKIKELEMSIHELPMKVNVVVDHAGKLGSNLATIISARDEGLITAGAVATILTEAETHITEIKHWIITVKEECEKVRDMYNEYLTVKATKPGFPAIPLSEKEHRTILFGERDDE